MCFLLLPHRKKGYFNRYYSKNLFGFFWISILNKVAPSSKKSEFSSHSIVSPLLHVLVRERPVCPKLGRARAGGNTVLVGVLVDHLLHLWRISSFLLLVLFSLSAFFFHFFLVFLPPNECDRSVVVPIGGRGGGGLLSSPFRLQLQGSLGPQHQRRRGAQGRRNSGGRGRGSGKKATARGGGQSRRGLRKQTSSYSSGSGRCGGSLTAAAAVGGGGGESRGGRGSEEGGGRAVLTSGGGRGRRVVEGRRIGKPHSRRS